MYYTRVRIYRLYAYLYKRIYLLLLFLFFIITYRQNDRIVTIKKPSAIGNMERYDVGPVLVCVSYPAQPTTKTDVILKENFVNRKCTHTHTKVSFTRLKNTKKKLIMSCFFLSITNAMRCPTAAAHGRRFNCNFQLNAMISIIVIMASDGHR